MDSMEWQCIHYNFPSFIKKYYSFIIISIQILVINK
jgi:hypothetical protein